MVIAALEAQPLGLVRLVEAARDRGHRVLLLTSDRSQYAYSLGLLYELDVVDVETTDVDKVVAVLRAYPGVAGLVRMMDQWSRPALAVARELGLPHENAEAVELLQNKERLRDHLYRNGFSRASSVVFDVDQAYEELVSVLPYPCIVKDVTGAGSENVWLVRHPEDLPGVLAEARSTVRRGDQLTAEPYFVGPLYSAETVSWGSKTRMLGVTSRGLSPEPHFREETASFPVRLADKTFAELNDWISAILTSVGYDKGVTHTEFIVTTSGLEIVEINARMGGGLFGESVNRALDINMLGAFVDLALGRRPQLMGQRLQARQGATQVFIYVLRTGIFDGIDRAESLTDHPGSPAVHTYRNPGDSIVSTIDQRGVLAFVFATGETAEFSLHNAMSAGRKLTVRMRENR